MSVSEERRKSIISLIEINKHMSIEELTTIFKVNEQVIYRDLIYLEKINKLKRTSKGAIYPDVNEKKEAIDLLYRETLHFKEKEALAKFATTLIKDRESIMIDGGSTTLLFATNLVDKKRLMVITNTSTIGDIIKKENRKNQVILTGGQLSRHTYATIGDYAIYMINNYRVNKAVIGVCAIDAKNACFYTTIKDECIIKQNMIKAANEVIILADSSKLNLSKPHKVCDSTINKKITLVIDKGITKEDKETLESYKINVITV